MYSRSKKSECNEAGESAESRKTGNMAKIGGSAKDCEIGCKNTEREKQTD